MTTDIKKAYVEGYSAYLNGAVGSLDELWGQSEAVKTQPGLTASMIDSIDSVAETLSDFGYLIDQTFQMVKGVAGQFEKFGISTLNDMHKIQFSQSGEVQSVVEAPESKVTYFLRFYND